jgi:hypothetical protein
MKMIGEELFNRTTLTGINLSFCTGWSEYPDPNCEKAKALDTATQHAGWALRGNEAKSKL